MNEELMAQLANGSGGTEGESIPFLNLRSVFDGFPAEIQNNMTEVTCAKNHDLTEDYVPRSSFVCAMDSKHAPTEVTSRNEKIYYNGITNLGDVDCLTAEHDEKDETPVKRYKCGQCRFYLCQPCYERASHSLVDLTTITRLIKTDTEAEWMRSKLMVVGEGGAGKTATVRSLLGLTFNAQWDSTVGAAVTQAVTNVDTSGGRNTGTKWGTLRPDLVNNFMKQVSVSNELGYKDSLSRRRSQFRDQVNSQSAKDLIIRNTRSRTASGILEKEFAPVESAVSAGRFAMQIDEVKPHDGKKKSIQFTIWDYGGQTVFYSLHHLFLTTKGIYLLVFNMQHFLEHEDVALEFLRFWLNSIQLHADQTPLLIVGTYLDAVSDVKGWQGSVDKTLRKLYAKRKQIVKNEPRNLMFFPLSNMNGEGIDNIRASIENASRKQEFLYQPVKVRWLIILDNMINLDEDQPWLPFNRVKRICSDMNMLSEDEVKEMLELFHDLGVILYFTNTVSLAKMVIIDPQWLIHQLSLVIHDDELHALEDETVDEVGLRKDVINMYERGVVSLDLLSFLWDKDQLDFCVDLMRRTLLISRWGYEKSDELYYLVPSLLPESDDRLEVTKVPGGEILSRIDFSESTLPEGCFQRLICLCVDFCLKRRNRKPGALGKDHAEFFFNFAGEDSLTISQEEDIIYFAVSKPKTLQKYSTVLFRMLDKINSDFMNSGLRYSVHYKNNQGNWIAETDLKHDQHVVGMDLDDFIRRLNNT